MVAKEKKYNHIICENKYFTKIFFELGIKPNYDGYYFLLTIVDKIINEGAKIKSFSKQLYPEIAVMFNKKECTIERNIRSLIDKCWNANMKLKFSNLWFSSKKPTCCKFIYLVKNYIISTLE